MTDNRASAGRLVAWYLQNPSGAAFFPHLLSNRILHVEAHAFPHAHADHPAGIDDHARPLSSRGLDESRRMGAHLATQSLVPELAIVSTARRTQETWHAASESGGFHVEKIDEPRIYESSAGDLLEVVRAQDPAHKRIMLVGHNPGMERLTAWLVQSGEAEAVARLQKEFAV